MVVYILYVFRSGYMLVGMERDKCLEPDWLIGRQEVQGQIK